MRLCPQLARTGPLRAPHVPRAPAAVGACSSAQCAPVAGAQGARPGAGAQVDLQLESGEYFLSQPDRKRAAKAAEQAQQAGRVAARQAARAAAFVPPKVRRPSRRGSRVGCRVHVGVGLGSAPALTLLTRCSLPGRAASCRLSCILRTSQRTSCLAVGLSNNTTSP